MSPKKELPLTEQQIALLKKVDQPSHLDRVAQEWVNDEISEEDFSAEVKKEVARRYRQSLGIPNSQETNGNGHTTPRTPPRQRFK